MRGFKTQNEYQKVLSERLYNECPKAVLAAIAVSALTQGGSYLEDADQRLVTEWATLHKQGIVPQPVPAAFRDRIDFDKGL